MELNKKEEKRISSRETDSSEGEMLFLTNRKKTTGFSGNQKEIRKGVDFSGESKGGRGKNMWNAAETVHGIVKATKDLSPSQEEGKSNNPYLDQAVIEMLAYVSTSQNVRDNDIVTNTNTDKPVDKQNSVKISPNKQSVYSRNVRLDAADTVNDSKRTLAAALDESYRTDNYQMQWWKSHEAGKAKGVSFSKPMRQKKPEKILFEENTEQKSETELISLMEERYHHQNKRRDPDDVIQMKKTRSDGFEQKKVTMSNFETENKGNKGVDESEKYRQSEKKILPSKAVREYQQEIERKADERKSTNITGKEKNSGEKTAASMKNSKDTGKNILLGKRASGDVTERVTVENKIHSNSKAISFVETAWKAGMRVKEEGFGKKNQERQFVGNEHEIISNAHLETKETSIKLTNLFITILFGIPIFPIFFVVVLLCMLLFGNGSATQGTGLSAQYDKICYLAAKYESGGDPDQTGGDGGNACGEFQFDNRYELGPFVSWCYEQDPVFYAAFQPFLGMTTELKSNETFYNAWHTVCSANKEVFEAAQCEYVCDQTLAPLLQAMTEYYGYDFLNCSDALKGCILSFGNRDGKYVASIKRYFDGTTSTSTDREIIERAYNAMIERRPYIQRWRYEKADCLALLEGTLDVYEPSSNAAGSIDWSWKKIMGGSEVGNLVAQIAVSKIGCGYSQSLRDEDGWYDCSSLVYRCYAEAGITYLNGKTAADEAQYLVEHGMTVSASELQPGDIIFYSYESNGRYRNISHVAIYIGNNEMVHAANPSRGVVRDTFTPSNLADPLYGRPQ